MFGCADRTEIEAASVHPSVTKGLILKQKSISNDAAELLKVICE